MEIDLGLQFRQMRINQGLTLSETARKAGISKSQLSRVERGKSTLTLRSFERVAGTLGYTTSDSLLATHKLEGTTGSVMELNLALGEFPRPLQESLQRVFWDIVNLSRGFYQAGRFDQQDEPQSSLSETTF